MKQVNKVEWTWTAICPDCGTNYDDCDPQVDDSNTNPIITCDSEEYINEEWVKCGCVF